MAEAEEEAVKYVKDKYNQPAPGKETQPENQKEEGKEKPESQ